MRTCHPPSSLTSQRSRFIAANTFKLSILLISWDVHRPLYTKNKRVDVVWLDPFHLRLLFDPLGRCSIRFSSVLLSNSLHRLSVIVNCCKCTKFHLNTIQFSTFAPHFDFPYRPRVHLLLWWFFSLTCIFDVGRNSKRLDWRRRFDHRPPWWH